ncbi:hypothetical protein CcI49_11400 [Frankia sp. CcI49]|uniref:FAS1-like dehydratase domain-containing protein n=1 Tax=Frankia sp. CcI49 TaxID=1745382 RepID=UPI0009781999|nr:MaoC family dehydratase N-terminal domain-containing protein [Frankia sp. CcI49]ONH60432.1 hypothetical protein CcI49_11400 [Frankia sp. CcI49]
MDNAAWNEVLAGYVADLEASDRSSRPAPSEPEGAYSFPLANTTVTADLIRNFANAIGDPNPLWRDPAYAEASAAKGIIAPPLFEICVAEFPRTPEPPDVPYWRPFNAGTKRTYHAPYRPGHIVHATDRFVGIEERSKPGRPYRLFLTRCERSFYSQDDELLSTVESRTLSTAFPPGIDDDGAGVAYGAYEIHGLSPDEIQKIHDYYEKELAGKNRRGSESRYWQDVRPGDSISDLYIGPYDLSDGIALWGVMGSAAAFGLKWDQARHVTNATVVDPVTNELRHPIEWHLTNEVARVAAGVPFAPAFGSHTESLATHAVTNWAGDDGRLVEIDSQVRAMLFHGDAARTTGAVTRVFTGDAGEHLVELDLRTATFPAGRVVGTARATVELPSRP